MCRKIAIALFVAHFFLLAFLTAKPDRRPVGPCPHREVGPYPQLWGMTQWGYMSQSGNKLRLDGNNGWTAEGVIRSNGKVLLRWLESNGKSGIGLYVVDGRNLKGKWGYADDVEEEDGELKGVAHFDHIRKVEMIEE